MIAQWLSKTRAWLGAQKPGPNALLFLTAFPKKQQLGESAFRSKQISKSSLRRGSDTVLSQPMCTGIICFVAAMHLVFVQHNDDGCLLGLSER
jgi:hypothetical protein